MEQINPELESIIKNAINAILDLHSILYNLLNIKGIIFGGINAQALKFTANKNNNEMIIRSLLFDYLIKGDIDMVFFCHESYQIISKYEEIGSIIGLTNMVCDSKLYISNSSDSNDTKKSIHCIGYVYTLNRERQIKIDITITNDKNYVFSYNPRFSVENITLKWNKYSNDYEMDVFYSHRNGLNVDRILTHILNNSLLIVEPSSDTNYISNPSRFIKRVLHKMKLGTLSKDQTTMLVIYKRVILILDRWHKAEKFDNNEDFYNLIKYIHIKYPDCKKLNAYIERFSIIFNYNNWLKKFNDLINKINETKNCKLITNQMINDIIKYKPNHLDDIPIFNYTKSHELYDDLTIKINTQFSLISNVLYGAALSDNEDLFTDCISEEYVRTLRCNTSIWEQNPVNAILEGAKLKYYLILKENGFTEILPKYIIYKIIYYNGIEAMVYFKDKPVTLIDSSKKIFDDNYYYEGIVDKQFYVNCPNLKLNEILWIFANFELERHDIIKMASNMRGNIDDMMIILKYSKILTHKGKYNWPVWEFSTIIFNSQNLIYIGKYIDYLTENMPIEIQVDVIKSIKINKNYTKNSNTKPRYQNLYEYLFKNVYKFCNVIKYLTNRYPKFMDNFENFENTYLSDKRISEFMIGYLQ